MSFGSFDNIVKEIGPLRQSQRDEQGPGKTGAEPRHQRNLADAGAIDQHHVDGLP